jgi:hypothetical protein
VPTSHEERPRSSTSPAKSSGIPTLAAVDPQMAASEAPGIGFAIDSNVVRRVWGLSLAPLKRRRG